MDSTPNIQWLGDSKERFLERVAAIEAYGIFDGKIDLGKRYAVEVFEKIELAAQNLNQYPQRVGEERVIPFSHGVIVSRQSGLPNLGSKAFKCRSSTFVRHIDKKIRTLFLLELCFGKLSYWDQFVEIGRISAS